MGNSLLSLSSSELSAVQMKLSQEGDLTSFAELKPIVRSIEEKLNSSGVVELSRNNPELERVRQMVLTSFFHVDLKFNVQVDDYPYEIPFKEPFPYRPTIEALAESVEFFQMAETVTGKNLGSDKILDRSSESWFSALTEERSKFEVPASSNLSHSVDPEKRVIKNPVMEYRRLRRRLLIEGENASFFEFKPTVAKIEKDLMSEETLEHVRKSPSLRFMHDLAVKGIKQVQGKQENDSLIAKPFKKLFPYRATIQAIYKSIRFFEVLERSKFQENPDSQIVERTWDPKENPKDRKIEPLYHFDRYKLFV